jgi:hypothetical protein
MMVLHLHPLVRPSLGAVQTKCSALILCSEAEVASERDIAPPKVHQLTDPKEAIEGEKGADGTPNRSGLHDVARY